jgi:Kef-type K+ transport system membrane component KefB
LELVGRRLGFESALTAGLSSQQIVVIGLLLGLVATANSPASTVAVINEVRARGPMTTVALGTTVLKDVVVILLMALTIMLSQGILDPLSDLGATQLAQIPLGVTASLAMGALIGFAVILYLDRVNKEVALFLLAVVILAIEGVEYIDLRLHFHLDFLLVCIAAGFVVENASKKGDVLIQGLERSSLPIYVIFFTFSGVGLDLSSLRRIWPLALGFVVWRAMLLYTTTWIGAARAGESVEIREYSWTAFVAQAGVTLGLAELVALRFPSIGERLRTFVLAVVALNQLIGPALFKWSLRRLGEDGQADLPE